MHAIRSFMRMLQRTRLAPASSSAPPGGIAEMEGGQMESLRKPGMSIPDQTFSLPRVRLPASCGQRGQTHRPPGACTSEVWEKVWAVAPICGLRVTEAHSHHSDRLTGTSTASHREPEFPERGRLLPAILERALDGSIGCRYARIVCAT